MKKKTIAGLLAVSAMTFAMAAVGISFAVHSSKAEPVHAIKEEDGAVIISTAADFNTVFNGSAAYYNRNIKLDADIDLNGAAFTGARMAGSYTGTFDGQGHTIKNYKLGGTNVGLFNEVGTDAVVRDVTFDWTVTSTQCAGVAFRFGGTAENVISHMRIDSASVFGVWAPAGFTKAKAGTYSNVTTIFDMGAFTSNADAGAWPAVIVTEDNPTISGDNHYWVAGEYATQMANKVRTNGASKVTDVISIEVSESELTLDPDASENIVLSKIGSTTTSVTWASADENIATVVGDADGAVITGVAGGDTTITVTVVSAVGTFTKTIDVSVNAEVHYVSDVTLSENAVSIMETKSTALSAVLTGGTYSSITWASSDTNVATVTENGLNATVKGIAPGQATVTVTVDPGNGDDPVSDECVVTVTESPKMKVYMAIPDNFVNLGNSGYTLYVYPEGTQYVPFESTDIKVVQKDTVCTLYLAKVDISSVQATKPSNFYGQLCQKANTGVRWGAGFQLGTSSNWTNGGGYFTANDWSTGSTSFTQLANANHVDSAVDFYDGLRSDYKGWTNSICSIADDADRLQETIGAYDSLNANVKSVLNTFYEVSRKDDQTLESTFADTINYLKSLNGGLNNLFMDFFGGDENGRQYVWVVVLIGSASVIAFAGVVFLRKKRHNK